MDRHRGGKEREEGGGERKKRREKKAKERLSRREGRERRKRRGRKKAIGGCSALHCSGLLAENRFPLFHCVVKKKEKKKTRGLQTLNHRFPHTHSVLHWDMITHVLVASHHLHFSYNVYMFTDGRSCCC